MYKADGSISDQRIKFVYLGIVLIFGILFWRFYDLQVKHYYSFLERSERNRVREVVIEPPRGLIYDRNGILLVENRPSYAVSVIPWEAERSPNVYEMLSGYLGYDKEYLLSRVKRNMIGRFRPAKVKRSVDLLTLSRLEEHSNEMPGVVYGLFPERFYPTGASMSHMLGYIREIGDADLAKKRIDGYVKGDLIGSIGLERKYEQKLRGEKGFEYFQVDALGRIISKIETEESRPPKPGNDLHLSIDLSVQLEAEKFMEGKRGSIILLDPSNGEIITFVSAPRYSLDIFAGPISPEDWNSLQGDDAHPLFNRATMSTYPPGSTYKLVAAVMGLEMGIIDLERKFNCPGYFRLGRRVFKCNRLSGHGEVNIVDAIAQSCNVFFYKMMLELGLDDWSKGGDNLMFGKKTGIDISEESVGNLPNRLILDKKYGEGKWQEGHLLNLVLGQGDLLVTPLQMVNLMMIIRNEGSYYSPHFARGYYYEDSDFYEDLVFKAKQIPKAVSDETWSILKEGMLGVIEQERGTGRISKIEGLSIRGKTGTAENPHGDDHSWFTGYVEDEINPLAFVVIVENAGGGSTVAAPIAKALIKKYYDSVISEFAVNF